MPNWMPRLPQTTAGKRLLTMLSITLVVAVPAGILRAGCVGDTCKDRSVEGAARAPFCSLPAELREQVAAGYRKGRSPEILGVAARSGLAGPVGPEWRDAAGPVSVPWPAASLPAGTEIALAIGGAGISSGEVPENATLADVAPTIAEAIGLTRLHPEVRSGSAWSGSPAEGPPSLVLEVVWKGRGTGGRGAGARAAATTPFKDVAALGVGTASLPAGSSPVDPATLMATLGSGALPSEHGITGTYTRAEDGTLTESWVEGAPGSVVAMLADDLDEKSSSSQTALVGDAPADVGLVGSDWYLSGDKDSVLLDPGATPEDQARRASAILSQGYGRDDGPDLLAVTMRGGRGKMAASTTALMEAAEKAAPGKVLYVLVSLPGDGAAPGKATLSSTVAADIETELGAPVIEAVTGGGFFLDQEVVANEGIAEDAILAAMDELRTTSGEKLFADRFSGVAVTFARYC